MEISSINQDKINYYQQKIGAKGFPLAQIAAVPLLLSPDLLYQLWRNFAPKVSHITVSDILLSSLLRPVGFELYKMEEEIRHTLLKELEASKKTEIAQFLQEYASRNLQNEKNIQQIHLSAAKSILNPQAFAEDIKNGLLDKANNDLKKSHLLDLYFQLEAGQDAGSGVSLVLIPTKESWEGVVEIERRLVPNFVIKKLKLDEKKPYQSAKERILICKATQNKTLNLGYCGLKDLSMEVPELFECVWLEELILSNKYWEYNYEIDEYKDIDAPKDDLENNILQIPNEIAKLKNLKKIVCGGWKTTKWKIDNLNILTNLPNLAHINISNTQVSDISFVKEMKSLTHIKFSQNRIKDIFPLRDLINLTILELNNNEIEDITPLANLSNLKELTLSNNTITDISALEGLKALTFLDLHSNFIDDLSPIFYLPQNGIHIEITSWKKNTVNIENNPIIIPPLDVINQGKEATVNYIKTRKLLLTPLAELDISVRAFNGLRALDMKTLGELVNCNIADLLKLKNVGKKTLTELEDLVCDYKLTFGMDTSIYILGKKVLTERISFHKQWISSIGYNLLPTTTLAELNLSIKTFNCLWQHNIKNLGQLVSYTAADMLKFRNVGKKALTEISEALERVGLTFGMDIQIIPKETQIIDNINTQLGIKLELVDLPNISSNNFPNSYTINFSGQIIGLNLYGNKIKDISFLKDLNNLVSLNLKKNNISDISELSNLTNLRVLILENNRINDIAVLSKFEMLSSLILNENEIKDISPILRLIKDIKMPLQIGYSSSDTKEGIIELNNNPLINPPIEVIKKGNDAIINWFERNNKDLRVFLIGDDNVGKTSLLKLLNDSPASAFMFEKLYILNNFNIFSSKNNLWSFAENKLVNIQKTLIERKKCFFLLMFEAKDEQIINNRLEDFVNGLQNFATHYQIVLIINKIDINRIFKLDNYSLREKYPQINQILYISCLENIDINILQNIMNKYISINENLGYNNNQTLSKAENENSLMLFFNNISISLNDIIYFKSDAGYVDIFTETGRKYVERISLKKLEELLPNNKFLRVNRSYIINLDFLVSENYKSFILKNGVEIPRIRRRDKNSLNLFDDLYSDDAAGDEMAS